MSFLGCPYPLSKTPRGIMPTQEGLNQIKADLLILLLTNPGERVMLPEFGTPLNSLLFRQNDEQTADEAREMIINSINRWEPRVTIEELDVQAGPQSGIDPADTLDDAGHILSIRIVFAEFDQIKEVQELVLELPLSSG